MNLFCHAHVSLLSEESCLMTAESYRCAPDEDDLTCEHCGDTTRVHYAMPGRLYEQVCASCFVANGGPQMVRDDYARAMSEDVCG